MRNHPLRLPSTWISRRRNGEGVDVADNTTEFFTDKLHYITSDASDNRNLINMIAGTLRADTARNLASVEEIQGQTRQHSRSNTLLVMKPTYNEVNMRECVSTDREQERHDLTSRDLKSVLIPSQHPNTVLFLTRGMWHTDEDAGPALFGLVTLLTQPCSHSACGPEKLLPGLHFQLLKICKWSQNT